MIWRKLLVWWAGLLAVAGGLGAYALRPAALPPTCGGVVAPPPNPHPSVVLTTVEFQPGATLKPKDAAIVRAYTNGPTQECELYMWFTPYNFSSNANPDDYVQVEIRLTDDGKNGDAKAGDGEWYGEWSVGEQPPPPYRIGPRVSAQFVSHDDTGMPFDGQWINLPEIQVVTSDTEIGEREMVTALSTNIAE